MKNLPPSKKLVPVFLMLAGFAVTAVMMLMELLGVGETGLGPVQVTWALVGLVIALLGICLAFGGGQRYLRSWREPAGYVERAPVRVLAIVLWFGLLTGAAEILVLTYSKFIPKHAIKMGSHYIWMAPLANVLIFAIPGLLIALIAWRRPRLFSLFAVILVFAFLFYAGLLLNFPELHPYASLLLAVGLAFQTSRFLAAHPWSLYRLVRFTTAGMTVAVVTMGLGLLAWQFLTERRALGYLPPAPSGAPNVLMIVMDTVRAQSMSLHGYAKPTTPNLKRWGGKGVVFEQAIAVSSWTLPSHASMLTGRFRHEMTIDRVKPVHLSHPTLAETLSEHGYRTGGFVANLNYCTRERGLDKGFAHYEDYPVTLGQAVLTTALGRAITNSPAFRRIINYHDMLNDKDAARVNRDFLDWLEQDNSRPFFAFLNYYDAHEPYLPPAGFDVMFGPNQPRGRFRYHTNDIDRVDKWALSPAEVEVERTSYDGAIAYLDDQIGRLLDELERKRLLQNTLVIITSDHGEQFGERNGLFGHGNSLYYSSLHVPLLFIFPSKLPVGTRVVEPISLRDLPITVTDLMGIKDGPFPGTSLTRRWNGRTGGGLTEGSLVLSEIQGGFGERWYPIANGTIKSLVIGRYHLIQNAGGPEELYNVEQDPFEERNLAKSEEGARILKAFDSYQIDNVD